MLPCAPSTSSAILCDLDVPSMRFLGYTLGTKHDVKTNTQKDAIEPHNLRGTLQEEALTTPDSVPETDGSPTEKTSEESSTARSRSLLPLWPRYVRMAIPYEAYNDHLCMNVSSIFRR
jgi:hypothetical protein